MTAVKQIQTTLRDAGFYAGLIDGDWGKKSEAALSTVLSLARKSPPVESIAWGKMVSPEFRDRVRRMAFALRLPAGGADWLMACMAFETGGTFSPAVRNAAGSGAVGLIQFMPATAIEMGTSVESLASMSPVDQLDFVQRYFMPHAGGLKNFGDVYMAILWPAAIGKPDEFVLFDRNQRPTAYRQNIGLDADRDGDVTRGECLVKIRQRLDQGLLCAAA